MSPASSMVTVRPLRPASFLPLVFASSLAALPTAVHAQATSNWTGNSGVNTLWSNPANWFDQVVPPALNNIRVGSTAVNPILLDSSRSIGELEHARFQDSSLQVTLNSALTLVGNSGSLIRSTNSGTYDIQPRLFMNGSGAVQGFLFGGNLLLSGGLSINNGQTVTVSHFASDKSITLRGPVVLGPSSTLSLDHGGGNSVYEPASTLLQGSTLRTRRQGSYTFTPNFASNSTGQLSFADGNVTLVGIVPSGVATTIESGTVNLGAADAFGSAVTNNGAVQISTATGYTLNSSMSGTGSVRFTGGSSRLFMGIGARSYTGETRVVSGVIQPLANNAMSAQSTVVLESFGSAIDTRTRSIVIGGLSGNGRIFDGQGSTVTLTVGNNNQSTVFSGIIQGTGSVDTGIINLVKNGTGLLDLTGNNTTTGSVIINAGSLRLNSITSIALSLNNRIQNSGNVIFNVFIGDVLYGSQVHSTGTLTKTGGSTLTLTNLSTLSGSVQISGGNLVLGGINLPPITAAITNSGQLTFNASGTVTGSISGGGSLVKSNVGTVELRGNLSYTGSTTVNGGTLRVASPLRPVTGGLTVAGGTAILEPTPAALAAPTSIVAGEFSSISISNGARLQLAEVNRSTARPNVLITQALTIAPTGFLDLTNNDMIFRVTGGTATPAAIAASLAQHVRTWSTSSAGLPGTVGLGTSLAFYTPAGDFTTLAVYNNAIPGQTLTSFNGLPVSANDVLVSYTYLGDTNLDGTVDAADIARILQGMRGAGVGWNFGDINHDGLINFTDLGRALAALRGQGAPLGSNFPTPGGVIPEPAALSLLALPALALTRRRRS